jgi:hypothetical protein
VSPGIVGPTGNRSERDLAAEERFHLLQRVAVETALCDLGDDRMPFLIPRMRLLQRNKRKQNRNPRRLHDRLRTGGHQRFEVSTLYVYSYMITTIGRDNFFRPGEKAARMDVGRKGYGATCYAGRHGRNLAARIAVPPNSCGLGVIAES